MRKNVLKVYVMCRYYCSNLHDLKLYLTWHDTCEEYKKILGYDEVIACLNPPKAIGTAVHYLLSITKGNVVVGKDLSAGKSVRVLISYSFRWWARTLCRAALADQPLIPCHRRLSTSRVSVFEDWCSILLGEYMCGFGCGFILFAGHMERMGLLKLVGADRGRRTKDRTYLTRYLNVNRQANGPRTPLAFRAERQEKENTPRFASKVMKTFAAYHKACNTTITTIICRFRHVLRYRAGFYLKRLKLN